MINYTHAHSAAHFTIVHRAVLYLTTYYNWLKIVFLLIPKAWEQILLELDLHIEFKHITESIRQGFNMGTSILLANIFISPNHKSALDHPHIINSYIVKEQTKGQYSGPFTADQ